MKKQNLKTILVWVAFYTLLSFAYLLGTDMIGWLFKEEDGRPLREFIGFVGVSWFLAKVADRIVEARND